MRIAIYFSGITGMLLLIIGIPGIFLELQLDAVFLISGFILLLLFFLPLFLIEKYRQHRKIDKIIDSYRETGKHTLRLNRGEKSTEGWGMNNSPFRKRRSGATWGGGNIKGATASRGTRKSFLK